VPYRSPTYAFGESAIGFEKVTLDDGPLPFQLNSFPEALFSVLHGELLQVSTSKTPLPRSASIVTEVMPLPQKFQTLSPKVSVEASPQILRLLVQMPQAPPMPDAAEISPQIADDPPLGLSCPRHLHPADLVELGRVVRDGRHGHRRRIVLDDRLGRQRRNERRDGHEGIQRVQAHVGFSCRSRGGGWCFVPPTEAGVMPRNDHVITHYQ
jgi:hypothetical protein